ncbi:MAG TPA: hypothetical protein VLA91_14445 [Acidimicrobiia bacterium]|nr:hypothetical protein [Acidimicrobiia bacterium]
MPWLAALSFTWSTIYSTLPLSLPGWYPDFWATTGSLVLVLTLGRGNRVRRHQGVFPRSETFAHERAG